jgi:uncharacterized circularly permuted ATP-grasp superfamily protein
MIPVMVNDQLDAALGKGLAQRVTVVAAVCNDTFRRTTILCWEDETI